MRARKIVFLLLVIGVMFQVGLMFDIPLKNNIITRVVNEPNLVYQPIKEYVNVSDPGTSAIVLGVGVFNTSNNGLLGEVIRINITLRDGTGLDFVDVSSSNFETDFQVTLSQIRTYVERFTASSLRNKDVLVTMDAGATTIGGQSASATMTVALIALVKRINITEDAVFTGVLEPNGRVGEIGELKKKTQIAAQAGLSKIIAPKTQCDEADRTQNIEIVCVETIKQALEEMTK